MKFMVFYHKAFNECVGGAIRRAPTTEISLAEYEQVATVDGEPLTIESDDLECLFRIMNVVDGSDFEMPQKLHVRSMSSGDVAVDENGQAHYCAAIGWEPVEFR